MAGGGRSAQARRGTHLVYSQVIALCQVTALCACSHIAERVLTHGDVGTPAAELVHEFAPLKGCFADVKDGPWWHGGQSNCQKQGAFTDKESSARFKVCPHLHHLTAFIGPGLLPTVLACRAVPRHQNLQHSNTRLGHFVHACCTRWQRMCTTFLSRDLSTAHGVQERIAAAKRWLEKQREGVIFLYGHSVFWKTFFSQAESLRNCEYRLMHW